MKEGSRRKGEETNGSSWRGKAKESDKRKGKLVERKEGIPWVGMEAVWKGKEKQPSELFSHFLA